MYCVHGNVDFTHSSVEFTGITDSVDMLLGRATLISNVALNAGSSKQGNILLAKFGYVIVIAYQLLREKIIYKKKRKSYSSLLCNKY